MWHEPGSARNVTFTIAFAARQRSAVSSAYRARAVVNDDPRDAAGETNRRRSTEPDADPVTSAERSRRTSSSLHPEFVEQRLCLFEVLCVEAFREPAVNRCQEITCFGQAALIAAQP
jgi:hypothetical protein